MGAGSAWVAIQFVKLPANICAFAEEVYEFCPDTVEQSVGLQNEKDDPERFEAARRLCPTLSAGMEQKLEVQRASFGKLDMPPQLRAMISSSSFITPPLNSPEALRKSIVVAVPHTTTSAGFAPSSSRAPIRAAHRSLPS